jgi:excisionase family DNA binding protein
VFRWLSFWRGKSDLLKIAPRKKKIRGENMKTSVKVERYDKNTVEIDGLMSEFQAADYLGISYENLKRSLRYNGLITYVKFRKSVRYRKADLDAYINKHRVSATI